MQLSSQEYNNHVNTFVRQGAGHGNPCGYNGNYNQNNGYSGSMNYNCSNGGYGSHCNPGYSMMNGGMDVKNDWNPGMNNYHMMGGGVIDRYPENYGNHMMNCGGNIYNHSHPSYNGNHMINGGRNINNHWNLGTPDNYMKNGTGNLNNRWNPSNLGNHMMNGGGKMNNDCNDTMNRASVYNKTSHGADVNDDSSKHTMVMMNGGSMMHGRHDGTGIDCNSSAAISHDKQGLSSLDASSTLLDKDTQDEAISSMIQ
jgi:hypothetical protein